MLRQPKSLVLPNRPVRCRIVNGPFRGANVMINPLTSLRYIFGLYEHELNPWITEAISQVDTLFDVGANHGYFSFGVLAAPRQAWAFEPQTPECGLMNNVAKWNESDGIHVRIENCFVSDQEGNLAVTLDGFSQKKRAGSDISRSGQDRRGRCRNARSARREEPFATGESIFCGSA